MFNRYRSIRRLRPRGVSGISYTDFTAKGLGNIQSDVCRVQGETRGRKRKRVDLEEWCRDNNRIIWRHHRGGTINLDNSKRYPKKRRSSLGSSGYIRQINLELQKLFPVEVEPENIRLKNRILGINKSNIHMCTYCQNRRAVEWDHWHSLRHHGSDNELNRIRSCRSCNRKKGSMDPDEFIALKMSGTERSQKIGRRLRRFEDTFGPRDILDSAPEVSERINRYEPCIRAMFQIINGMVKKENVVENPLTYIFDSFKTILPSSK